jgi:hypothetical protein
MIIIIIIQVSIINTLAQRHNANYTGNTETWSAQITNNKWKQVQNKMVLEQTKAQMIIIILSSSSSSSTSSMLAGPSGRAF